MSLVAPAVSSAADQNQPNSNTQTNFQNCHSQKVHYHE
jgi:hypothetical protein